MSDVLQNYKKNNKSQPRTKYTLDEALTIIRLLSVDELSLKQIAKITAASPEVETRTVHSLRYKFKEGALTKNDGSKSKYTRSLNQFETDQELFTYFGVEFVSAEDVEARIASYRAKLVLPAQVVSNG